MTREILFLAHRTPWPPDRGDRIRSWHIFDALTKIAPVHLGCISDNPHGDPDIGPIGTRTASFHIAHAGSSRYLHGMAALLRGRPLSLGLFQSGSLHRYVKETLKNRPIGCIFAFSGQMAQFVPHDTKARFVMDFVDVDSAKFESYAKTASIPMRWIHAREGRVLAAWEKTVATRADVSLFVSKAETTLFRARSGLENANVRALENGTDIKQFNPDGGFAPVVSADPLIVFTGQMDYRPNIEAVDNFAHHTMPRIRAQIPNARFVIVGRNPTASVRMLAQLPGVDVTGTVPDVRGWLAAADVVVAPLRIARGVQNKVLEAMAMATPVVASTAALEGIDALVGRDLLCADGPEAEAAAVVSLLGDPRRAAAIGAAARARIVARYGWDAQLAGLGAIIGFDQASDIAR